MFCPKCGIELADGAEFCIECGIKLRDFVPKSQEPEAEVICKLCGSGRMVLVEGDEEGAGESRFRCSECGAYFGNLLRTGIALHYSTEHLRIVQFISNRIIMSGSYLFEVNASNENMEMDCIAAELARELEMNINDAKDSQDYLMDSGVLIKYVEEKDGKRYLGLRLAEPDTEMRRENNSKRDGTGNDELMGV